MTRSPEDGKAPSKRTRSTTTAKRSGGHVAPATLPLLPRWYLPRARLWDRLELAVDGAVTLVVAPVGAGKTLGVAGWLRHSGRAAEAIWLASAADLTIEDLDHLTSMTDADGRPRLVVLDDAQVLPGPVLSHLDDRLNQDPESMRLVLISRWDLPLSRLVPELLGHLTVLRGDLLRLDKAEVSTLVAEQARTDSAAVAEAIYARAGGWCAAVVLAARAVASSPDPLAAAQRLVAGTAVVDQVAAEVFAALSARERHVLLCVAPEVVVSPSLARHLSRDADAGRILDGLESTGLLVSRYVDARQAGERFRVPTVDNVVSAPEADDEHEPSYRLHPLLVELARRRLIAGGVDVERARASVRRAVGLDLGQGILRHALRRLVAVGDYPAAARLLCEHGVTLVLAGEAGELGPFVRHHIAHVEKDPGCMFPVALHRWLAGDLGTARHWLHRLDVLVRTDGAMDADWQVQHLCARLMLARLANEGAEELIPEAEAAIDRMGDGAATKTPLRPLLRLEVGVAHLHAGRFAEADRQLATVLVHTRAAGLHALTAEASSQLALSQVLQGREHAAVQLVDEALATDEPRPHAPTVHGGAVLARDLAQVQALAQVGADPDGGRALRPGPRSVGLHPADALAGAMARMLTSRRLLLRGFVSDAERTLDSESVRADVPPVVRVPLLVEQALEAALATDRDRLARLEQELTRVDAVGEASLVAALRADLAGDARTAVELCDKAAGLSTCAQPPVAALALAFRAQLVDSEGRSDEALADLREAMTTMAVRRNALPFLGWSRHGTPIATLLRTLSRQSPSAWADELLASLDGKGAIVSVAGPLTATPRERAHVPDGVMRPSLSPRERDVLHELARGATYADIAADLYVSENTVKTHVSSLYAKLAVSRRSDALAVARTLQLL